MCGVKSMYLCKTWCFCKIWKVHVDYKEKHMLLNLVVKAFWNLTTTYRSSFTSGFSSNNPPITPRYLVSPFMPSSLSRTCHLPAWNAICFPSSVPSPESPGFTQQTLLILWSPASIFLPLGSWPWSFITELNLSSTVLLHHFVYIGFTYVSFCLVFSNQKAWRNIDVSLLFEVVISW